MTSSWQISKVLIVAACLLGFSGLVSAQSPTLNPTKSPTRSPTTAPTQGYSAILSLFAGYGGVTGIDPSSTVKVDVQLVDGAPQAIVYCGAFFTTLEEVESNTKTVPFTSTSDIYKQGYSAYTSAAGLASVVVSGMTAASRYNIYCMTVSILNSQIQMPYSVAIQTSTLVTTQCCKLATFSTAITSMYMQTSSLTSNANALTLTLNAAPSASNLKFTFKLYNRDTGSTAVADVGSLSVTTINVPKTYTPGTPYSIVLNAGNPGYYKINVTMSGTGTSGDEYNLVYSGLNVIQVLSDQAEPPAPKLLTSVFSADGTYVIVTFDSPTAGLNTFKCGDVFTFDGSSSATCLWKDSKRAFIYPTYSATSSVLGVGSKITLKDNVIQAYCTDKLTLCTNWELYAAAKEVTVTVPSTTTLPTVVMSGPSTVGPCIPINLDLSNSVGAAGRPWKRYTVTVTAPLPAANLTAIRSFLNSTTYTKSVSPPQPIPAEVLAAGYTYTFTATFCNFLGACGTASKAVAVTNDAATPIVSIVGLNTRTITTWTALSITVDAYTKSCLGSKSAQNLQYVWTVYEVGASNTPYTAPSVSQNPATFKLNPYALKVSTTYQVQVSVTSTIGVNPTPVTASVFVVVTPSTIVPVISGGSSRSIQTGTTYVVDASKSYDRDVSGAQTGIKFSWSCYQTSPSYNSTCNLAPFKTTAAGALTTNSISVSSATAGTTSRVTVTVYDTTRTSSTYMDITVTAAPATVITVGSNLASLTSVNVNQPIQLTGALTLATPCTAQWSVSGASIDLQSVSPTPVSADYTSTFTGFLTKSMTLLLPGGSLPQRATLGFTLTCGTTKSTISMTTNGAPLPGSYIADPTSGAEMDKLFKFTASMWQDPDLPMSYQFGFISATTSSLLVFQSRSESSFASTKLAAGPVSTNYAVNATLQVFDVYGASAVAQTRVFVTPLTGSAQNDAMSSLISGSSGSVDDTNAVIATCSTALNAVDCTSAPDCNSLHRSACAVKPNTCGACMAGYIGVSGLANVKCLSIAEYNDGGGERRRLTVGGTCLTSSSCNAANWESCVNGKCVQDNKPCPSNSGSTTCSGHGTCGWLSKNTLESVSSCGMSDSSCKAQCTCATGFAGANCASTIAELEARTKIRSSLIGGLKNVTSIADISEENLISWSTSLNSLAINGDELTVSDAQVIHHIANLTINYAKSMGSQNYASLMGLLTALDTASSIVVEDSRRRRLTGDHRALATAVHADILSTAGEFGDVIANGVAAGQEPNTYIMDNFRMTTQKISGSSGQIIDIPGPQDDLEYYSGQFAPYFTIEPSTTGNDIATSMVLVDSKTFGSAADDMQSDPMQIRMGSDGIKTVRFTLVNKESNAAFAADVVPARVNFTCTRAIETQTKTCPGSNVVYSLACTGIAGVVYRDCPRTAPQCSMFDTTSLGFSDSTSKGCSTVGFTEDYITCECDIDGRRRLTADIGTVLGATGVTNMVTTSTYIATSFGSTFKASTSFTSPEAASKVLIVILMFAILWAVGLLSLVGLCFKKQKRIQKTSVEKRRSHKAGSQTHTTADIKRYLLSYVDKLIPDVYHATKSKVERAVDETRKHHRYLQLFTARDDQISPNKRILTLCKMLTVQTMLMFLLAVLYDLEGPDDDGTCVNYTEQGACTNRKSILDSSQTYCKWEIDENIGLPHCIYQQPVFTAKIMMYIIILTSIFTSIFNTPIDRLFDTLEAPTGESVGQSRLVKGAKAVASGARRASVAAVGAAKAVVAAVPKRMTMFGRLTNANEEEAAQANRRIPEDVTFAHTMAYMALPEISAQAQVAHLRQTVVHNEIRSVAAKRMTQIRGNDKTKSAITKKNDVRGAESTTKTDVDLVKKTGSEHTVDQFLEEIMQQRLILPTDSEETNQFDLQWGIEKNTSTSTDGKTVSTSLFINGHSLRGMSKDVTSSDERAKELKVKMEQCSDNQAGLDILHLFMVDLLGRHTLAAKIFENKFEEDFERTRVVSKYTKWLTLFCIVALNGFFMYYALLKGYSKGVAWQNKYLQGCIAQLVIEIVLFESIECVWINYWVPDLVSSEVMTAGIILRESAEKISLAEKNQYGQEIEVNTKFFLDAPSYLFVSTKLAKSFPNLLESIIVSSYHNHLPGEISRTWRNERAGGAAAENEKVMRNSYAGKRTVGALIFSCVIALSSGLSIMLQALGSLPYFYQRIIIRFVQPVLLSGLTLLWYFAIKNPVYIGIIAAVMIVAGFVLYIRYKNRENNSTRPGKIAPVATGAGKSANKADAAPLNKPVGSLKQLNNNPANSIDKNNAYSSVDSSNENAEGRVAPHNPTVGRIDEGSSSSGSD